MATSSCKTPKYGLKNKSFREEKKNKKQNKRITFICITLKLQFTRGGLWGIARYVLNLKLCDKASSFKRKESLTTDTRSRRVAPGSAPPFSCPWGNWCIQKKYHFPSRPPLWGWGPHGELDNTWQWQGCNGGGFWNHYNWVSGLMRRVLGPGEGE